MKHIYKPSEIKVKKNKNGNCWQTVLVEDSFGRKRPFISNSYLGSSMYEAKKFFADDLNRINANSEKHGLDCSFSVHENYFLKSKKNSRRKFNEKY